MRNSKIIILIFFLIISSCANKEDNKLFGQILGSAAGAYLGSKFGSGVGKDLSMIFGGAVGFLIGGKIAEILDDEEEQDFNETISKSLNENKDLEVEEWMSSKNNDTKAEVIPLNKYEIEEKHAEILKKLSQKKVKLLRRIPQHAEMKMEIGGLFSRNF